MKLRNLILIFMVLSMIIPAYAIEETFISGYAGRTIYPNVDISKLRYEPYPVKPGDYFDLWLEIQNTGEEPATNFVMTFVENYPFFLDPSEKPTREFSEIGGGQVAVVKYKVRVDESAVEEAGDLKVRFKYDGKASEEQTLNIDIQTVSPVFMIETETTPERLKQGELGTLKVSLSNTMSSVMRDITLKLDLDDLPFTPVGSSTERKIGSIASGSKGDVEFSIMPSPKAASGVYKIPVSIDYYDKSGTSYTKDDTIGVLVDDDAEFQLNLEDSEVFMNGDSGKVVVSISNIAESDVKFLSIELLDSDYYKVLTNPRIYIGNLEADDYETAEFNLFIRKSKRGKVPLNFLISYKDPFNQAHTNTKLVGLPIYNYFQATSYGLIEKKTSIINILLSLLFLLFIYRTYKEWKKQRDLEASVKITAKKFYIYGKKLFFKVLDFAKKKVPKRKK